MINEVNFKALRNERWKVIEILPVLGRQENALNANSLSGDNLLLDATNGQDLARQRHFTRHGDVLSNRMVRG